MQGKTEMTAASTHMLITILPWMSPVQFSWKWITITGRCSCPKIVRKALVRDG